MKKISLLQRNEKITADANSIELTMCEGQCELHSCIWKSLLICFILIRTATDESISMPIFSYWKHFFTCCCCCNKIVNGEWISTHNRYNCSNHMSWWSFIHLFPFTPFHFFPQDCIGIWKCFFFEHFSVLYHFNNIQSESSVFFAVSCLDYDYVWSDYAWCLCMNESEIEIPINAKQNDILCVEHATHHFLSIECQIDMIWKM